MKGVNEVREDALMVYCSWAYRVRDCLLMLSWHMTLQALTLKCYDLSRLLSSPFLHTLEIPLLLY